MPLASVRDSVPVSISAPVRLTVEDKLEALRKLDPNHQWDCLDDQRYCTRCDHLISGRQIEVAGGTRAHGPLRLECPTPGCIATPADWANPPGRNHRRPDSSERRNDGDGAAPHHAGYVEIRAKSEGISITHNGRAAVAQTEKSRRVVLLPDLAQLYARPRRRQRVLDWLLRNVASVGRDCRSVLKLLRPSPRAQFHPVP